MAPNDETKEEEPGYLRSGKRKSEVSEESPEAKKANTGNDSSEEKVVKLEGFNINFALMKEEEIKDFKELKDHPVQTLQGIGPKLSSELEKLGLKTIQQMADYKFFHLARCIKTLASTEETGNTSENGKMNLNFGLIKEYERYSLKDLLEQPIHALQGLSEKADETFSSLGVKNIEDFANLKYFHWAEAIVIAAKWEETL